MGKATSIPAQSVPSLPGRGHIMSAHQKEVFSSQSINKVDLASFPASDDRDKLAKQALTIPRLRLRSNLEAQMKIVIYSIVQVLLRVAPQDVKLVLIFIGLLILALVVLRWVMQLGQHLHTKVQAFLILRRARQKLSTIERRMAADALLPTPLDPYRHGGASTYQKEIDDIVAPLNSPLRSALIESKGISAALKEALQRSRPPMEDL
jgi:hypothetical protein